MTDTIGGRISHNRMRLCEYAMRNYAKIASHRISHTILNIQNYAKNYAILCDYAIQLCVPLFWTNCGTQLYSMRLKHLFSIFFLVQKGLTKKIEFHNCDLQNVSEHKLRFRIHHSGLA